MAPLYSLGALYGVPAAPQQKTEGIDADDDDLASRLRSLESERAALDEHHNALDEMLVEATVNEAKNRAEAKRQALLARSASLMRAEYENMEAQLFELRAAAADDNERVEELLVQLRQEREEAARQRDRVAIMELQARVGRQQFEAAESRAAANARRLHRRLAYVRWRQLAAARALQYSRRTKIEDAVHVALQRASSSASLSLSAASASGPGGDDHVTDVDDEGGAGGASSATAWTLDAWLDNLPLKSLVVGALRARLFRANSDEAAGAERAMVAAIGDGVRSADEHGAIFSALFTEASLLERLSESIADEVDSLGAALKRSEEGRRARQRRLRAVQQRRPSKEVAGASHAEPTPPEALALDPTFGRMVSEDGGMCAWDDGMGRGRGARLPTASARDPMVAMRAEHCTASDSQTLVTLGSYEIRTASEIEFTFVLDPTPIGLMSIGLERWPVEARIAPDLPSTDITPRGPSDEERRRIPTPLGAFDAQRKALSERLAVYGEEMSLAGLVACRLYCGPLVSKYNAALRLAAAQPDAPPALVQRFAALNVANYYATTIQTVDSTVRSLARLTVCCPIYRGLGSGELPHALQTLDAFGCRAICEPAFLSATSDVKRAYAYGESADAIVLEIGQGLSGRAADLRWLSQYPHEEEWVLPAGTTLEMHRLRVEGSLALCEVRAVVTTPTGNASTGNASSGNAPTGNAPAGNAPAGNAPTGARPTGNVPTANAVPVAQHSAPAPEPDEPRMRQGPLGRAALDSMQTTLDSMRTTIDSVGGARNEQTASYATGCQAATLNQQGSERNESASLLVAAISKIDEANSELQAVERRAAALRAASAAWPDARPVVKSGSFPGALWP